MKNEQKLSFWKKIKISITDFDKYQELAAEKISRTIGYIAILVIILSIVVAGIYVYKFTATINNVKTYVADNIETVDFTNNKLTVIPKNKEKVTKIENEELQMTVIINTNELTDEQKQENIQEISGSQNGVLILSDKIMFKTPMLASPYEYKYETIAEQFNINKLDKQELINLLDINTIKPLLATFYIVMFIYLFIIYFSTILVDIIMLSVLAYIVTMLAGIRLKYSALYNIAAYAITLSVILNVAYIVVNAFTGFTIKYFQVMYTAIASIYIVAAILMIKSDVIKKQVELAKIVEEQEKVRLELLRKEEERKEQEEKEKQEKEEAEKRKKEEKEKKKSKRKKKDEEPNLDVGNQPSTIKEQE